MTAVEDRGTSTAAADDWRHRAACRDVDPETAELFFCIGYRWDTAANEKRAADAKAICASCPTRVECLDWALTTGMPFAIAGGLTDTERSGLRARKPKERARPELQPCGTPAAHRRHLRNGEEPCQPCRTPATLDRALRKEAAA